jgi:hypothetical protein
MLVPVFDSPHLGLDSAVGVLTVSGAAPEVGVTVSLGRVGSGNVIGDGVDYGAVASMLVLGDEVTRGFECWI